MKKNKSLIFLIATISIQNFYINSINNYNSKTFLFTRPNFNSILNSKNYFFNTKKNSYNFKTNLIVSKSTSNLSNGNYFLLNNKNCLRVKSAPNSNATPNINSIYSESYERDILAQWLTNSANFSGEFSLNPNQTSTSCIFEFSSSLKNLFDTKSNFFKNILCNIALPITNVSNYINYSGSSELLSIFNSKDWTNLKIAAEAKSKCNIPHIKFGLSSFLKNKSNITVTTSSAFLFPLNYNTSNNFLFSPFTGFNAHFAAESNFCIKLPILKTNKKNIALSLAINNVYMFSNNQNRTFDLYNKPLSRYIKIYDKAINSIVPGVNVLTKYCKVSPYNFTNFNTEITAKKKSSKVAFGYELFAHGAENICLTNEDNWIENRYGIASIDTSGNLKIDSNNLGLTASNSTINFVIPDDTSSAPSFLNNIYIKTKDLNLNSAASAPAITHKFYISTELFKNKIKFYTKISLLGFIELTQNNSAFSNIGCAIKFDKYF